MDRFIIEHRDGGRWLTQHGFTHQPAGRNDAELAEATGAARRSAMSFSADYDATDYLRAVGMYGAGHMVKRATPAALDAGGVTLSEYNPFSVKL